jgi:hypothetical protein
MEVVVKPDSPFAGQYSDLPFQDPWWKVLLLIICIIIIIAAAVVAVVFGGPITIAGLTVSAACCVTPAAEALFAVLIAAAGVSGIAAGWSDVRDPFRRGQDNTVPAAGELTTAEQVDMSMSYPEPVALGKPFAVGAKWKYTRMTTGSNYSFSVSETNNNVHVLSRYMISAPNVIRVYRKEPFIIKGEFFGPDDKSFRAEQLFVQCFLVGQGSLKGQFRRFIMQDDGISPDEAPSDGVYTGIHWFTQEDSGFWHIYVIAQDVNYAQPNMTPDEAAKIIGGMVLTHQLTINFSGGTCPLVPDGDVHVI